MTETRAHPSVLYSKVSVRDFLLRNQDILIIIKEYIINVYIHYITFLHANAEMAKFDIE